MKTLMKHLLYLSALLLAVGTAHAATITVDAGGACTLADAITAANTDTATGGCPAGSGVDTITLQTDVTLAAALPEISSLITIEGSNHFISGNNDSNVGSVLCIDIGGNLTMNETAVKNGNGGGIYNYGTVTLTNSTVSGNTSYSFSSGGGIYNNGTVTLTNSTVSGNTSFSSGGGIYNNGTSTVTLTNSTVSGNTASSSSSQSYGGGIYNNGTVTLTNSTVSDNIASSSSSYAYGGGIFNYGFSTVTLTDSTVSGNTASAPSSSTFGGGIYNYGTVTLTNSTVSGNTASATTTSFGGGIYNYNGTVTLTNSTVSGNNGSSSSSRGGGIYTFGGTVTLTNSTVSGNTAFYGGGGIYNIGTFTLQSSIISGNTAIFGNEVYDDAGTVNAASFNVFGHADETSTEAFDGFILGTNDVDATSSSDTATSLDAILDPALADNGGPTQTHALVAGSPAVDLDKSCSTKLTTDQRGEHRPLGNGCDAGSYEGAVAVTTFTITASAGTGGSISPVGEQTVNDGETISFTVIPNAGYTAASAVGGTCPQGSWNGSTYTTGAIKADCSVVFSFTVNGTASKTNMAPIYKLLL